MKLSKEEITFRVRKTAALATLGAGGYKDVMEYFNQLEAENETLKDKVKRQKRIINVYRRE